MIKNILKTKEIKFKKVIFFFFVFLLFATFILGLFSNVATASLTFFSPQQGQHFPKGSSINVLTSFVANTPYKIDLYKGSIFNREIHSGSTSGFLGIQYNWTIPADMADGAGYIFKITENPGLLNSSVSQSPSFSIGNPIEISQPSKDTYVKRYTNYTIIGKTLGDQRGKSVSLYMTQNGTTPVGYSSAGMGTVMSNSVTGEFEKSWPFQYPFGQNYQVKACLTSDNTRCSLGEKFTINENGNPIVPPIIPLTPSTPTNTLTVTTLPAGISDVSDTTAVLRGSGGVCVSGSNSTTCNQNTINQQFPLTAYFRYTTQSIPPLFCNDIYSKWMKATGDYPLQNIAGNQTFSTTITNLSPDTTYYYCAIISNRNQIAYGGKETVRSFKTLPCIDCHKTEIVTGDARAISNSAYLRANYSSTKTVKTYFEYRETAELARQGEALRRLFTSDATAVLDGITSSWKKTPEQNHFVSPGKEIRYVQGNLYQNIVGLKPSTSYVYRAVAEISEEGTTKIMRGETKQFTTGDISNPNLTCLQLGNCPYYPEDPNYCIQNPTDPYCSSQGSNNLPDLTAGQIRPTVAIIDKVTTFISAITNLGNINTTEFVKRLVHSFHINDNSSTEISHDKTKVVYVTREGGIPGRGYDDVPTNQTFTTAGIKKIRACASTVDTEDPNLSNNCGPWTTITVLCEAPKYYDLEEKDCLSPLVCEENEIFDWNTKTCLPKPICEKDEIYNPWSNTCIIPPVNCAEEPQDRFCQPGPGWYWNNNGTGWGTGGGNPGTWGTGGWVGNTWYGLTWTGNGYAGNTWTGGSWQNGIWTGGSWSDLMLGQNATPPWDAIVRNQEGVEHVFARQILGSNALQGKYGYQIGTSKEAFAWDIAHLFAKIFGYIDANGREIRVSRPDIAAYELRLSGDRLTVYEYYNNVVVSIQNITDVFKTKAGHEYYFKK
ncbi:MAG TPA: hypothetical protein VFQ59_01135 [Candidatus Paceibacterota bacterium]|nr:hypothetical protein [Candidatus Paceibacterota bacterium]